MADVQHLTELIYSDDISGTLRLYIYREDGRGYDRRTYFARRIRYPDEEVPVERARMFVNMALIADREIRITNGADFLVFHAMDGVVLYPEDQERFWSECAK